MASGKGSLVTVLVLTVLVKVLELESPMVDQEED
jgi:hypothetical protein